LKESRFTEEQIINILREAERGDQTISAVCRSHAIAETTFYKWRQKYGGMEVPDARRLRELERENSRLKRLLAERDIEIDAMKECWQKSGERTGQT
jgi:putative transposase